MVEVKDNFLDKDTLVKIQKLVLADFFPYYYNLNIELERLQKERKETKGTLQIYVQISFCS